MFDLTVAADIPLGDYSLTFTTPLGSDTTTITVVPTGSDLLVSPAVVRAAIGSHSVPMHFSLSEPDQVEHTLTLSIEDGSIATLSPISIQILVGATEFSAVVQIIGFAEGQTTVIARSPRLGNLSIPVFVGNPIDLPVGSYGFSSPALGVVLNETL